MSVAKTGDHIIFGDVIYECIFALFTKILTKLVITYTRVDTSISENAGAAIQPNTSLIYIKTQSNPTLKLSDIKKISTIVHSHKNITFIVDNTFISTSHRPWGQLGCT